MFERRFPWSNRPCRDCPELVEDQDSILNADDRGPVEEFEHGRDINPSGHQPLGIIIEASMESLSGTCP